MDRFAPRYYDHLPRAVEHAILSGAPQASAAKQEAIVNEVKMVYYLSWYVSCLQTNGVIPFAATLPFKHYLNAFKNVLNDNPYAYKGIDGRWAQIMESSYQHLMTSNAVYRLFIDPNGEFYGKPFKVEKLLAVERFMGAGDVQAAMFAIEVFSHKFRSPTERMVADGFKLMLEKARGDELVTEDLLASWNVGRDGADTNFHSVAENFSWSMTTPECIRMFAGYPELATKLSGSTREKKEHPYIYCNGYSWTTFDCPSDNEILKMIARSLRLDRYRV